MDICKLFHKYIQDKQMQFNQYKKYEIEDFDKEIKRPTDYERGYLAEICHAYNEIQSDLHLDNSEIEIMIDNNHIGTRLKYIRRK